MTPASRHLQTLVALALLGAAGILSLATSPARPPPTHRPVYLSWKAFRAPVRTEPPRPIAERGKIYTFDTALFLAEPGEGIHVIDNANPETPRQVAFLPIPGCSDLAIRGPYLYADSLVDLLVFELSTSPLTVRYVTRAQDVFPYDMASTMPRNQRFFPTAVDRKKGIVVRWEPLKPKERP